MMAQVASLRRAKSRSSAALMAGLIFAHPQIAAIVGFVGLLVGLLGWGMAYFVKYVIDHSGESRLLSSVALGVGLMLLFRSGLLVIKRKLQVGLVHHIEGQISRNFLSKSLGLDVRAYDAHPTSDLYSRLRGLEHLRQALEERVLGVAFEVVLVLIAAVIMARFSLPLTGFAMLGALLPAGVVYGVRNSIQRSFLKTQESNTRLTNDCMDAFDGVRDLRAAGGEAWILDRLTQSYAQSQDLRSTHLLRLSVIGTITSLLSALASVAFLLIGAHAVRGQDLTSGDLMFLFTLASTMLGPLESLVVSWLFFDEAAGALDRCQEILELPGEPREARELPKDLRGRVQFEGVTFSYQPERHVLHDISVTIPEGTSLAIVGESGAGKSTFLSLLAGHYAPDRGSILIDGVDLSTLSKSEWSRRIGVVFQSPHLFVGTIDQNIRMGCPEAGMMDLEAAVRLAGLEEFIRRLPEGVQTKLSRGGSGLSAGQIQRIAIARALVRKPRLVLLDEATSNLDAITESAIWSALSAGSRDRTTVFVTHRLSSSVHADLILVLDKGRVVEAGRFADLIERRGYYYKLWRRQLPAGFSREEAGPEPAPPGDPVDQVPGCPSTRENTS